MWFRFLSIRLSFNGLQILVLGNGERFDDEAVRVVVAPCGVKQPARGHKASHRQAAFPDNQLAGIGVHLVGVLVEVERAFGYAFGKILKRRVGQQCDT